MRRRRPPPPPQPVNVADNVYGGSPDEEAERQERRREQRRQRMLSNNTRPRRPPLPEPEGVRSVRRPPPNPLEHRPLPVPPEPSEPQEPVEPRVPTRSRSVLLPTLEVSISERRASAITKPLPTTPEGQASQRRTGELVPPERPEKPRRHSVQPSRPEKNSPQPLRHSEPIRPERHSTAAPPRPPQPKRSQIVSSRRPMPKPQASPSAPEPFAARAVPRPPPPLPDTDTKEPMCESLSTVAGAVVVASSDESEEEYTMMKHDVTSGKMIIKGGVVYNIVEKEPKPPPLPAKIDVDEAAANPPISAARSETDVSDLSDVLDWVDANIPKYKSLPAPKIRFPTLEEIPKPPDRWLFDLDAVIETENSCEFEPVATATNEKQCDERKAVTDDRFNEIFSELKGSKKSQEAIWANASKRNQINADEEHYDSLNVELDDEADDYEITNVTESEDNLLYFNNDEFGNGAHDLLLWDSIYENIVVHPKGSIDRLPDELLVKIFSYIPSWERMPLLPRVCTNWRRLTADGSLSGILDFTGIEWHWLWFTPLHNEKVVNLLSFLRENVHPRELHLHLHHTASLVAGGYEKFIDVCHEVLNSIVNCDNLKTIRISSDYKSSPPDVPLASDLSPALAALIIRSAQSLQVLELKQLRWTYFHMVVKEVMKLRHLQYLDLCGCQREETNDDLLDILQLPNIEGPQQLQVLDIERSGLHIDAANWLLSRLGTFITELYLLDLDARSTSLHKNKVHHFNRLINLRAVSVSVESDAVHATADALSDLHQLETLILRVVDPESSASATHSAALVELLRRDADRLPHLRHVGIMHRFLTTQALNSICKQLGSGLQSLVVRSSVASNSGNLASALSDCPQLVVLSLVGGTRNAVEAMARYLVLRQAAPTTHTQLRYLNFDSKEYPSANTDRVCDLLKQSWPEVHIPGMHFSADVLQELQTKLTGAGVIKIVDLLD